MSARELARLSHEKAVGGVAFSPDGTRIATASYDNTARVWDSASGRELARLAHYCGVTGVAFSPDGTRIATATRDIKEIKRGSFMKFLVGLRQESHGYAAVWGGV